MNEKEVTSIEAWIARGIVGDGGEESSAYDVMCELAVSSYKLDSSSNKQEFQDVLNFFCKWWHKNRYKTNKYRTFTKIAALLKRDHTSVSHHINKRKPSLDYNENVACIKDFLES